MKNTVTVEKKIIGRLKLAAVVTFIFCCCMIFMLVSTKMIEKQNLNGNTNNVKGTITKVKHEDDIDYITVKTEDGESTYNVVFDSDIDWNNYIDSKKTVTVITTQQTFAINNLWAIGFEEDGNVIVDYNATLETLRAENKEMITVSAICTGILAAATLALFIWRVNINPVTERPLDKQFSDFAYSRQPTCPQRKKMNIAVCVYIALLFICVIALTIVASGDGDNLSPATIACLSVFGVICIGGITAILVLSRIVFKKEIDFYAVNCPFDFTDLSHMTIRKKVKAELQKQIKAERELYPDVYGEGGNGYDVEFTPSGVNLYIDFNYNETPSNDISQVFEDMPSNADPFSDTVSPSANVPQLSLSYAELNFVAVPFYRKTSHPLTIMVKSRLNRRDDFPEEFQNDIHFLLDSNLLETFKKFNVVVENLDYILENKKQLMLDNCYKRKTKKQ